MHLKCLACDVLARPIYLCAAQSPHIVDIELFKRGLHNTPKILRATLQERIDAAAGQGYDAVVMAYGLCGQATAGLRAADVPVIVPRAHDCITIFLGSRERYGQEFERYPGTYWYALDYMERDDGSGASLGASMDTGASVYEEYVEKYGVENADYLMEVMGAWQSHYQRAAFVDMGIGDGGRIERKARDDADRRGWVFERVAGDLVLVRRLLNADWQDDFLVLQPGESLKMTHDAEVIGCVLADSTA
ncbi:MAG: DUF1638 domain-containing protein [Caldilineales bacterium]|nr:DUF1638 domain-containing protein [Caldilineales bacterium]